MSTPHQKAAAIEQDEAAQEAYISEGGRVCPMCEDTDISVETLQTSGAEVTQECECNECGATWRDRYGLIRFEALEPGPERDEWATEQDEGEPAYNAAAWPSRP